MTVVSGVDSAKDVHAILVDTSGRVILSSSGPAQPVSISSQTANLALETGGNLAAVLAKLDVALSTRALEAGGNLASILAKLDVALSTRAADATLTTAGGSLPGIEGYDGSAWKKQGLIWAYKDRYAEQVSTLTAAAGTNTLNGTAVPAGEVWVVQAISVLENTTTATVGLVMANLGGVSVRLLRVPVLTAGVDFTWTGRVTLKQGDYITATYAGVTLNDDLYLFIGGYKMGIAM